VLEGRWRGDSIVAAPPCPCKNRGGEKKNDKKERRQKREGREDKKKRRG